MRYLMLTMLLTATNAVAAHAETAWVYDGNGDVAGTIMQANPNNSFIYGRDGDLVGSTARAGNTTYIYGADGGLAGSVINSRPSRRDLDME